MPVVTTKRLCISPLTDGEMQEKVEKEPDGELKKAYSQMLAGCEAAPEKRIWYALWAIRQGDENGQMVGDLCFKGLGPDGGVEIGYGTYRGYEGQGYMTEAVIAMTAWAMAQPGVAFVEAETEPGNAASQRVLEKAGFLPSGKMGEEGPRFIRKP